MIGVHHRWLVRIVGRHLDQQLVDLVELLVGDRYRRQRDRLAFEQDARLGKVERADVEVECVLSLGGAMYAAVGSYIARVWRIFGFRFPGYPPRWTSWLLAAAIYVNFFAHHWLPDIRLGLFAATALLFWRTRVCFTVWREERWMPLLLGWFLVALFIWLAENVGTFSRAWMYPGQEDGWELVSPAKLGAWYLLMIISFVLVEAVHGRGNRS